MVPYPVWTLEVPVVVPTGVTLLGDQGTYLNATAESLLEGAQALLAARPATSCPRPHAQ